MRPLIVSTLCLLMLLITACQDETPKAVKNPPPSALTDKADPAVSTALTVLKETIDQEQSQTEGEQQPERKMPEPPIFETFQGEPQLTLFPRAGDFRPADNSDNLPYWNVFIEHLVKVTGVAEESGTGNRAWVFRGIKSIDSVGYFSPLAVKPQTQYKVSFNLKTELAEGASAGIGLIEFDQFLWIPHQYTEETFMKHLLGSQEGKRLTGTTEGEQTFTFTTNPKTAMIHLVLFREGAHDRNDVRFDNIRIEEVH